MIMSDLFFEFFDANNLPRDSDLFDGRSDYGPFLAAGIPAGGVDAGADKTKTEANRLRYQRMTGWGGVAGEINDQVSLVPLRPSQRSLAQRSLL